MSEWWNGLSLLQQILACIAIPSTVILLLQTVLMLFGLGSGHADADAGHGFDVSHGQDAGFDHDHDFGFGHGHDLAGHDADAGHLDDGAAHDQALHSDMMGLNLFTLRGILSFFAVGGWLGVVLLGGGMSAGLAVTIAFLAGLAALVLVALMLKSMMKLQDSGNMDLTNAIGRKGRVYISIPASLGGEGKVNITIQEQLMELSAMTDENKAIKAGTLVEVVKLLDGDVLLVRTGMNNL